MRELGLIGSVGLVLLAVLFAASELGFRAGRRRSWADGDSIAGQAATWEGALLGLLALLIGFTFAMAVTRFDGRRELILDEANAVEETALRAQTIDPQTARATRALLRKYVDARVRYYEAGLNWPVLWAAQLEIAGVEDQLWAQVAAVARARPDSEVVALYVESANQLVSAASRRRAALDNHVPLTVLLVLGLVAATAAAATGYSCGLHGRRHSLGMTMLPVLIALVLLLVVDLDQPRIGVIRAGQGPIIRLQQSL
jgi:hypothetical protein